MFGTIRKHSQWLWVIIIAVIIVSFVLFFSPDTSFGPARETSLGSIYGRKIKREEYLKARSEEMIGYRFSQGRWPGNDDGRNVDQMVRRRLVWQELMKRNGVRVSDEAVALQMATFFRSPETGAFSEQMYDNVVKTLLPQGQVTEDDMIRYFRTQVGVNQLIAVMGSSGKLVAPRVTESLYKLQTEQLAGTMAYLPLSNYTGKVVIETNALMRYFTNATYMTPIKKQVAYVAFMANDYLAAADQQIAGITNLAEILNTEYRRRLTNVPPMGTNTFKDLPEAQAKEQLRKEFQHQAALMVANSNAVQFANAVYALEPVSAANLEKVAKDKKLTVKETAPFSEQEGPAGLPQDDAEEIGRAAFQLTAEMPLGQQAQSTNGVYVLAHKGTIPSQRQPFEEVRERVMADYRQSQALELLNQAGVALQKSLSDGVAAGKAFKDVAGEAKATVIEVPFFSMTAHSLTNIAERVPMEQFIQMAMTIPTGKVGRYVPVRDGGFVFYARERKPVDDVEKAKSLPAFLDQVRDGRQNSVVNEWFSTEFDRSGVMPIEATVPVPAPGAAKAP